MRPIALRPSSSGVVALRRSAPSAPSACRRRTTLSPSVVACHSLSPLSFPLDCLYALGRLRLTGYCFLVLRHWFCSIVCSPCTPLPRLPSVWGLHPGGFFVRHPLGAHYPFAISSFCTSCTSPALALVLPARPPRRRCRTLPGASSRRSWTGPTTTVTPTPRLCQFCENAVLSCFRSSCAIFVFRLKFFLSPSSSMVTQCFLP